MGGCNYDDDDDEGRYGGGLQALLGKVGCEGERVQSRVFLPHLSLEVTRPNPCWHHFWRASLGSSATTHKHRCLPNARTFLPPMQRLKDYINDNPGVGAYYA